MMVEGEVKGQNFGKRESQINNDFFSNLHSVFNISSGKSYNSYI